MNDNFLIAAQGGQPERIPVWFMRQAGRSLPGYRELRKKYGVLELAQTSDLAAQVSMEPVQRLGVDAAVLFADIMLLPIAMGVGVRIVDSVGPIVDEPIQTAADIAALKPFQPDQVEYLQETIRILVRELDVPVIGFSAAPFTLASYLIEGQPTRTWRKTKQLMYTEPELWHQLMSSLSVAIIDYLKTQANAGAHALQLFDSWVGCLSPADYRQYVLPHVQMIFAGIADTNIPRVHFGTDTAGILPEFCDVDCEMIGLDWRHDLARALPTVRPKAVQGNLDPAVLLGNMPLIQSQTDALLTKLDTRAGFVFNFGHGVMPETDDVKLKALVEYIHGK